MSLVNPVTVFELLDLRYQWEELVRDFKMDAIRKNGTLENLKYFLEFGAAKNRFRNGFKEAQTLAAEIMEKF